MCVHASVRACACVRCLFCFSPHPVARPPELWDFGGLLPQRWGPESRTVTLAWPRMRRAKGRRKQWDKGWSATWPLAFELTHIQTGAWRAEPRTFHSVLHGEEGLFLGFSALGSGPYIYSIWAPRNQLSYLRIWHPGRVTRSLTLSFHIYRKDTLPCPTDLRVPPPPPPRLKGAE